MSEAAVQLKLAGQTYQVVTSASEKELRQLAQLVEAALHEVTPEGKQASPQSLVLAAITLAHELEQERKKRAELEERHRKVLHSVLGRVDRALAETAHLVEEDEEMTLPPQAADKGPSENKPVELRAALVPVRSKKNNPFDRSL